MTSGTKRLRSAVNQHPKAARSARLLYVLDTDTQGIRREWSGDSFRYLTPKGHVIRAAKTLDRIQSLAIPPAWTDVWICPNAHGHIQATGRDQRGRKQYLYHSRWREARDATKFDKMISFAKSLPVIRTSVNADLRLPGMPRQKVLATIVRLLESTLIRVGNEKYAKSNRTYGLTTMRNRHVKVDGRSLRFDFVGKSGIRHQINLHSQKLAVVVRECQELPGQRLFQYIDDEGNVREVSSVDVNEYLRNIAGEDFTAKDFRTWGATLLAMRTLQDYTRADSKVTRRKVTQAIKCVAAQLGNTPAVCRACYVHPQMVDAYLTHSLPERRSAGRSSSKKLSPDEKQVLALLVRAGKQNRAVSRAPHRRIEGRTRSKSVS